MIFEFESTNFFLVVAIVIILFATILFFIVEMLNICDCDYYSKKAVEVSEGRL